MASSPRIGSIVRTVVYLALLVAVLFWLLQFEVKSAQVDSPAPAEAAESGLLSVEATSSEAQSFERTLILQGQVTPNAQVDLRAEIAAAVLGKPVSQGSSVEAGTVLLKLDPESRQAQLDQAEADLAYKERDLAVNRRLNATGGSTENEVMRLTSEVANARLAVENARLALKRTRPTAPFAGIIDQISVDPGDYLAVGEIWGRLVAIDQLKVTAQAPQQEVGRLEVGQAVVVRLLDGQTLSGHVSYVAYLADEATRSYQVEALVDNPDHLRIAGGSASMEITTGAEPAHAFSPALLTLDDEGEVGVRVLDEQDRVRFAPVTILSLDKSRAWVSGLPSQVRLITVGAGFAELGQKVEPVSAGTDSRDGSGVQ
ncbi:MAG: efflux transporter periplasmic adaptor subunit [Oceanospirillaceae bacterium]|nr:efflux transporter periplasmic adaptor subunit [Oceanospirillaceae bacterium]